LRGLIQIGERRPGNWWFADDRRLGRSGRSQRRADQRWKGLRAGFPHDGRTMIVDGTLADTKIGGDVLAWMSDEDDLEMGLEGGSIIAISDRLGLTTSVNAKLRPTCHWPNCRRQ
jgi:hypothetical protein